jgi:16S rRNA (uracil1498-N3)-methyltransferase
VQVLRLQPGAAVTLFNGEGGEWDATIERMGRSEVQVRVGAHHAIEREASRAVHLALGMPANERMDWLVEKATELGVASLQPLVCERSVLRLTGERAQRKVEHWQAVAASASEQCGRAWVPQVAPVLAFEAWIASPAAPGAVAPSQRWLLSPGEGTSPLGELPRPAGPVVVVSGPEGGLSPAEVDRSRAAGFLPVGLGPRVLRAETAPVVVLAWLGLRA